MVAESRCHGDHGDMVGRHPQLEYCNRCTQAFEAGQAGKVRLFFHVREQLESTELCI